jgi:glycosyltransferase involved in cell wall biosynthesis
MMISVQKDLLLHRIIFFGRSFQLPVEVSVVMPCFNASETIGRALESVASQTFQVREIIVVDDGSADLGSTRAVIDMWARRLPLVFIAHERNLGAAAARNTALRNATSAFVAFLDADDVWMPQKIAVQLEVMLREKALICGHRYVSEIRSSVAAMAPCELKAKRIVLRHFLFRNIYSTPTVMIDRRPFIGFDEALRRCDDYHCWITNISSNGRAFFIDAPLAGGFKPAIGSGGLTGAVYAMHTAFVEATLKLYKESRISALFFFGSLVAEYLKIGPRYCRVLVTRMKRGAMWK